MTAPLSPQYVLQNQEIKYCQGCAILSIDRNDCRIDNAPNGKQYYMTSKFAIEAQKQAFELKENGEIYKFRWTDHHYRVPHKLSCVVLHVPNHPDCHNYHLEKVWTIFTFNNPHS